MKEKSLSKLDKLAVEQGCYFDAKAVEHVATFFSTFLRHSREQWRGQPFHLLPWQLNDVVAPIYGWKNKDGTRRIRQSYLTCAKKQGKTGLMAGLVLYHLLEEPQAEVYSVANDRDQASIIFREASQFVRTSPALAGLLEIKDSTKTIYYKDTGSFYRALSSESGTKEGLNASAVFYDEISFAKDRQLYDAMRYAGAARRQPLHFYASTAGTDKSSIGYLLYKMAKQVQAGLVEDITFHPVIYEVGFDEDWKDIENIKKASPSWGVTFNEAAIAAELKQAKEVASEETVFRNRRCNQWVNAAHKWLPSDKWDNTKIDKLPDLTGRRAWVGLDLASKLDVTALVLVFPPTDDDDITYLLPFFWIPQAKAEDKYKNDNVPYFQWAKSKDIEITSGDVCDYAVIRKKLNELRKIYKINDIAFDPWNAEYICSQLADDGFTTIEFNQSIGNYTEATKEFESLVVSGKVKHSNNVLQWMGNNCMVRIDTGGNMKPDKKNSGEKIDGICAAIMGLARSMLAEQPKECPYKKRGIIWA